MEISFSGKRALVTGAAQGIGLAIVKKLVSCGAQVVALDIQEEKMKETLKELPGVEPVVVDLTNRESLSKALQSIGHVQLVVNNAGLFPESIEDLDKVIAVNLKAVISICQHFVKDMTAEGIKGAIVNIATISATQPNQEFVYGPSKAAVLQYTRNLALDCAPKGIRVNAVSPGLTKTDMLEGCFARDPEKMENYRRRVPMEDSFCDPEDIANAVAFLLCDQVARRITGVNLYVDLGLMLT